MYGIGVSVGDFDNDGRDDVYITALEGDRLFHNDGHFKFRDVTKASGIANASFGTSAAWLDYDKDGRLDLFVANYVKWSVATDLYCSMDGTNKTYCTPETYKGAAAKLYHNLGSGKFEDVGQKAGIADPTSKSLGVAVLDYDGDGWPDIFLANDTTPNRLYRNNRNGTFTEEGVAAGGCGVQRGRRGSRRHGCGCRRLRSVRTVRICSSATSRTRCLRSITMKAANCSSIKAPSSPVGRAELLYLAFGVFFVDYDLDSHLDVFAANGHIEEAITKVQPKVQYKEPPLMFRNTGTASSRTSAGRWVRRSRSRRWREVRRTRTTITTVISTS